MKFLVLVLLVLAVVAVFVMNKKNRATSDEDAGGTREKKGSFAAREVVTANEQGMFWRLAEVFPMPEYIVLTQVSFGALLNAKGGASRYSFAQKRADFVLTNRGFRVIAVIELDDASHKGKEAADAERDAMLTEAGYRVLRYNRTPDRARLLADLLPKAPAQRDE